MWEITFSRKVKDQIKKLPKTAKRKVVVFLEEMEKDGPHRSNWPNYGKLSEGILHCHIKKGNPTYVAVWEVLDKKIKLVEVRYVGTHEKAPY